VFVGVFPVLGKDYRERKISNITDTFFQPLQSIDHPPCVINCPVQATWKREDGIVIIDEHRCIAEILSGFLSMIMQDILTPLSIRSKMLLLFIHGLCRLEPPV